MSFGWVISAGSYRKNEADFCSNHLVCDSVLGGYDGNQS